MRVICCVAFALLFLIWAGSQKIGTQEKKVISAIKTKKMKYKCGLSNIFFAYFCG